MSAALEMSAPAQSRRTTPQKELDQSLAVLKDKARAFARLAPAQKAALIRETMATFEKVGPEWVADGCRAKAIPLDSPVAGEEWLAGPVVTMRNLRLLAKSLDEIAQHGK